MPCVRSKPRQVGMGVPMTMSMRIARSDARDAIQPDAHPAINVSRIVGFGTAVIGESYSQQQLLDVFDIPDLKVAVRYGWDDAQGKFSFFLDPDIPYVLGVHADPARRLAACDRERRRVSVEATS